LIEVSGPPGVAASRSATRRDPGYPARCNGEHANGHIYGFLSILRPTVPAMEKIAWLRFSEEAGDAGAFSQT
jgi:hypothetical protein